MRTLTKLLAHKENKGSCSFRHCLFFLYLAETQRSHPYVSSLLLRHSIRLHFPVSVPVDVAISLTDLTKGYEWKGHELLPGPPKSLISFPCPLAEEKEYSEDLNGGKSHDEKSLDPWRICTDKQPTSPPDPMEGHE